MWLYKGKEYTEKPSTDVEGFVYLITNTKNGKKYIGQKKLWVKNKKLLVKRDKNNKIIKDKDGNSLKKKVFSIDESDWESYYGSNEEIKTDKDKLKFKREIIIFLKSKALMNYIETYLQIKHNVLFSDNFYNGIINIRASSSMFKRFDFQKDIKPIIEEVNKFKIKE